MYFYYMLAAMGPQYQKFLWWKKYMTELQIVSVKRERMWISVFGYNSINLIWRSHRTRQRPWNYLSVGCFCAALVRLLVSVLKTERRRKNRVHDGRPSRKIESNDIQFHFQCEILHKESRSRQTCYDEEQQFILIESVICSASWLITSNCI